MAGGAAARLQQPAIDRKARVSREVEIGHHARDLRAVKQFGVDAGEAHGVAAPGEGVRLPVGMGEVERRRAG